MNLDLLERIETVRNDLERLGTASETEVRFALIHCVKALRMAKDADGLSPDRRKQVRSAYRMGCAALSIEHE